MKKITFLTISLALISSVSFGKDNSKMRNSVLHTALYSADAMCSSRAYTNCYGLTKSECEKTIKPMIKECFSKYKSSIFNTSSNEHLTLVGNKIGRCAGNKYHDKLAHKADKMCLDKEDRKFR